MEKRKWKCSLALRQVRKPLPPPTKIKPDKTKYNRKQTAKEES